MHCPVEIYIRMYSIHSTSTVHAHTIYTLYCINIYSVFPVQPPPLSQGAPLPTSYETASLPPVTGSTYPPPLQTEPPGVGGPWAGALQPLRYHWFYLRAGEKYWIPFSQVDCNRLEEAFVACGLDTSQEVHACIHLQLYLLL